MRRGQDRRRWIDLRGGRGVMIDARIAESHLMSGGHRGLGLRLLGGFAAWVDGAPVDGATWRRRKVSRLVKLLALAPEHRLHREQVEGLLWPALDPRAVSQNLHHTL